MMNRFACALFAVVALSAATAPGFAAAPSARGAENLTAFALNLPTLMPELAVGPLDNDFYRLGAFGDDFMLSDDIGLYTGFNVDVARALDGYADTAFDGLFLSSAAERSSYLTRASGGAYAGVHMMLTDGLRFSFGQAFTQAGRNPYLLDSPSALWVLGGAGVPFDARSTNAVLAGLSWDFTKWGNLSLTASRTNERDLNAEIAQAKTTALGVSGRIGFGGGWVTTLSYAQATTRLSVNPIAAASESGLHSQSYGVAVAKQGLFGHDALGLSLSRPATGGYTAGLSNDMQFQFYGRDKLFSGLMPETDIEVGYVTSFLDRSIALDVNAAYQMNYQGQNRDEVSFISRAKIKF